jgi:hypothetical protein
LHELNYSKSKTSQLKLNPATMHFIRQITNLDTQHTTQYVHQTWKLRVFQWTLQSLLLGSLSESTTIILDEHPYPSALRSRSAESV